jgi:hypothetical protein
MLADGFDEAADRIASLEAENRMLVEGLEWWNAQAAAWMESRDHSARPGWMQVALEKARALLNQRGK